MLFETRVSECMKYIYISVRKEINYAIAYDFIHHAYVEASRHGIRNFFFDVRGVRNVASTQHNYRLIAEDAPQIGYDRTAKIAILIDFNDPSHDFIETVASSAGYNCKIFSCQNALLEWIQI